MSKPSTRSPDQSISETDWEQTPASVREYVQRLLEEGRRTSQNSSQPPSQDCPSQKRSQQENKTPSERTRGGQIGHESKGRTLLPLEAVSEVVIYRSERCQGCGAVLIGSDPQPYRY